MSTSKKEGGHKIVYDHNREAVSNIINLMLNDDYLLDILLDYNRLLYVTDGSSEKNIIHVKLLEYKIDLSDCLDTVSLERMKEVSIIAVHGEVINEELTREALLKLSEGIQAIKSCQLMIGDMDEFILCNMVGLSEIILEDVIKQEKEREKA